MVDVLAEGHLVDEVVIGGQLLADVLPRNGVQQIEQADVEGQDS